MIRKIDRSLAARIFLITFAMLLAVSGVTYGFISWALPVTYVSRLDSALERRAREFLDALEKASLDSCDGLFREFRRENGAGAALRHPDGTFTFPGLSLTDNPIREDTVYPNAYDSIDEYRIWDPGDSSSKQYDFSFADQSETYTLFITGKTESVNQVTDTLIKILPWLALLIAGVSLLTAWGYSRYLAKPVVGLSMAARKMAELDFSGRCEDGRRDEIGILGKSMNNLSQRLSAALSQLQEANWRLEADLELDRERESRRMEFFSAVSHELKTPITIVKGQLEGMLQGVGAYQDKDKYLARSLEVMRSMESMVGDILRISRLESAGFSIRKTDFDFSELVREQLSRYMDLIEQKSITWEADLKERLILNADRKLMEQVISNLLNNAIQYSPGGAALKLTASGQNKAVSFSIENTGAYIPEEELPRLFDAFYRVESSRNRKTGGSGLGLYIVGRILRQHNADYQMENTDAGVRFSFTVTE